MSWSDGIRAVAIIGIALVSGCGFQMQGGGDFPPEMGRTYVQATDRYSMFYRKLTNTLRSRGVTLADSPAEADTIVRIIEDDTGQRVLSVSPRNVPEEYQVFYVVRYSVAINGQEVLPEQRRAQTRDYAYDETAVLGKASEEQILRESIADDLVALITRQLATL